ncbi:MAG: dihydroneopterin aldolase [Prevotellaceae bacterium]|jgi:dihydroneopterin aldolase|nr:dihydroneopterin aldolase [Prevotellaceae bacterium]
MATISLEGMEFYAHHGCFAEEQKIGTKFVVDVYMEADHKQAAASDKIENAINYQKVYNVIREQMHIASNLLESVSDRVANSILEKFPNVESISVKVAKMNPPIGGQVKLSSVTVTKQQSKK